MIITIITASYFLLKYHFSDFEVNPLSKISAKSNKVSKWFLLWALLNHLADDQTPRNYYLYKMTHLALQHELGPSFVNPNPFFLPCSTIKIAKEDTV